MDDFPTLNSGVARTLLQDPDTPAFVLLVIAHKLIGEELYYPDMDPAELWDDLRTAYHVTVSDSGQNRLNALLMGLRGDLFYRDPEVFVAVCLALYSGDLGNLVHGEEEEPHPVEIMWGVVEVEMARGEDEPPEFSGAVRGIISKVLYDSEEDQTPAQDEVKDRVKLTFELLRRLGIPAAAIRLLDEEYRDGMESVEPDAISESGTS